MHTPPLSTESPQLTTAFRPFFLGAAVAAIVSVTLWTLVYTSAVSLPLTAISSYQWHAHEMIYGYVLAVIAGFLLTAVVDWTGQPAVSRKSLTALVILWLVARLLFGVGYIRSAGLFDILFVSYLSAAMTLAIIRAQQWRQMAVVSKLVLLGLGNVLFYLGALGVVTMGVYWGVYGGFYLVLGLILTMGRRLLPTLLESGEPEAEELGVDKDRKPLFNSIWLDMSSLLFFFAFFVSELMAKFPALSAWLALAVGGINGARLIAWYRPAIWKASLLWSFYLSLWMIAVGFLFFAISYWFGWSRFLALHVMAVGGIGLVTLSMMCRVIVESSSHRVTRPPSILVWAFAAMLLATVFRVVLPMLWPGYYMTWIVCSQVLWAGAFLIFVVVFMPRLMGAHSATVNTLP